MKIFGNFLPVVIFGFISLITTSSAYSQSGDSVIDTWIGPYALKTGNDDAPTLINPSNYTGGVLACNGPGATYWEGVCPSDLSYTPNANTGGYQAFGIGLTNYEGGEYYLAQCYYLFYPIDPYEEYLGYYVIPVCEWYEITVPDQVLGTVGARIRFGDQTVNILNWGDVPLSTLAFKGNNVYTPTRSDLECDPDITITLADAPCDSSDSNVVAVPDVGYEDKILIEDKGCTPQGVGGRNGSVNEALANCFVYDSFWYADLPTAYKDTVRFDGAEFFTSSTGTPSPETFDEGQTYLWLADFYQLTLETSTPGDTWEIRHNSAVTTYYPLVGCPALCFFNVEQTTIAPVINY